MTAQILIFRPRNRPGRLQAMRWLAINSIEFPEDITNGIGSDLFFGWRFMKAIDGIVYFANCIHGGITREYYKKWATGGFDPELKL